jgi:GNAT superfamily N-acetyltransferase
MDYTIRLATPNDVPLLPHIERFAATLFSEDDLPAHLRDDITPVHALAEAQAASLLWIAADARDQPVGFAFLDPLDDCLHLWELDVHPDHGRRGLGTRLVEASVESARQRGLRGLTLTTYAHVAWNAPYYERLGFVRLTPERLTPGLREALAHEAAIGLDPARRVAMRRDV